MFEDSGIGDGVGLDFFGAERFAGFLAGFLALAPLAARFGAAFFFAAVFLAFGAALAAFFGAAFFLAAGFFTVFFVAVFFAFGAAFFFVVAMLSSSVSSQLRESEPKLQPI